MRARRRARRRRRSGGGGAIVGNITSIHIKPAVPLGLPSLLPAFPSLWLSHSLGAPIPHPVPLLGPGTVPTVGNPPAR